MDSYQIMSKELHTILSKHALFNKGLSLDLYLIFGGVGLLYVTNFVYLGGLVYVVAYYGFLFGLLFAFSNQHNKFLYTGLFLYAGTQVIDVLQNGLFEKYRYLDFYSIATVLIFGYIGYVIYKYDKKNESIEAK